MFTPRRSSHPIPERTGSRASGALAPPLFLVMVAIAALALPRLARPGEPPQLGGFWQLDLEKSETLQQKLDEMHRSSGGLPGGGGWHGGMGGGPPMGGMGGHHGGYGGERTGGGWHRAGGDSTRRAQMSELAHPAMSLHVEPSDDAIVLSERGRTIEVLVLGDAATAGSSIQPDAPHFEAQWKGKRLVAETVGSGGGHMTQEFELEGGGKQLIVRTKLEGREGRPPLELKRVYNRAESEDVPGPPAAPGEAAPGAATPAAAAPDSSKR